MACSLSSRSWQEAPSREGGKQKWTFQMHAQRNTAAARRSNILMLLCCFELGGSVMCVVIWQGEKANGLEKEEERGRRSARKVLEGGEVGAPRSQGHKEQMRQQIKGKYSTHTFSLFFFLFVGLVLFGPPILPPFLTTMSASTSPPLPFPFLPAPPIFHFKEKIISISNSTQYR